jgi:hypothetical protein
MMKPAAEPAAAGAAVQPQTEETSIKMDISSSSFLDSAREALMGIPADLLAGRGSLYEVFTRNNRLRGLGVILILVSLIVSMSRLLG